jgi:predicted DNA-binding transcriptional regulator YafY
VFAGYITLNEALLRIAAIHGVEVEFSYAKGEGSIIERRRLIPENIQVSGEGNVSFVGQDPDRDDVRQFRLDRIKGQVSL